MQSPSCDPGPGRAPGWWAESNMVPVLQEELPVRWRRAHSWAAVLWLSEAQEALLGQERVAEEMFEIHFEGWKQ